MFLEPWPVKIRLSHGAGWCDGKDASVLYDEVREIETVGNAAFLAV